MAGGWLVRTDAVGGRRPITLLATLVGGRYVSEEGAGPRRADEGGVAAVDGLLWLGKLVESEGPRRGLISSEEPGNSRERNRQTPKASRTITAKQAS